MKRQPGKTTAKAGGKTTPRGSGPAGARKASVRPGGSSMRKFYIALGAVAIAGSGVIAWLATRPDPQPQVLTAPVTAAQSEGYLYGNASAPVQIMEFADFQCPACAQFAAITEPDVRRRIVDAGLASFRFYDYPLPQHRNSLPAHLAAACAADQGKFWEMHDRLFEMQPDWSDERNPKGLFERYARDLGLDMAVWEQCYDAQRPLPRIRANAAEGDRRGVRSTPTFVIGNRVVVGSVPYDELKAHVDSALASANAAQPMPAGAATSSAARSSVASPAPADSAIRKGTPR
ncbi:MAG: DsbA family protein [Gemmatimonadaceae bacterium]